MTIAYVSRLYGAESGNLGAGTFADPWRPLSNPAIDSWLAAAPAGSVLCFVDGSWGTAGVRYLTASALRSAAAPGRPLIISGDPARWGDAPAASVRAQMFGFRPITASFTQIGSTGVYELPLSTGSGNNATRIYPESGVAYNPDPRSDIRGTAQRDSAYERLSTVFHPQDCYAVPHTACRTRKLAIGTVTHGQTLISTFGSYGMTLTAVSSGTLGQVNSPGLRQFMIGPTAADTAANLAQVINGAANVSAQVTDYFTGGNRAAWWTGGAGSIANDGKCGSTYDLQIADDAQGVWKTGQSQRSAQIRFRLCCDGAGAPATNDTLRLELAKNATTGEVFSIWLRNNVSNYSIGANTSRTTAPTFSATLTTDTVAIIEARYDADTGAWWVWVDGMQIASGTYTMLTVTDVGIKSYAGTGAASLWRLYVDEICVWFADTSAKAYTWQHYSAWAQGAVVYLPQLLIDTTTLTGTAIGATITATSDLWLVHLIGEADPSSRTWYGVADDSWLATELQARSTDERVTDIVFSDLEFAFTRGSCGFFAPQASDQYHPRDRIWTYRTRITFPHGDNYISGHALIFDRIRWWTSPNTGPYFAMDAAAVPWDATDYPNSPAYTDNLLTDCLIADSLIAFVSSRAYPVSLLAPNADAHAIGLQSSRNVDIINVQARGTADLCYWLGGTAALYPTTTLPFHRPDVAGEDRVYWDATRPIQRVSGKLYFYWVEDQQRRVTADPTATSGKYGIDTQKLGAPVALDLYGIMVKGWPYGAPGVALRLFVAHSGDVPGSYGVRVRGLASLWCSGITQGGDSRSALWPVYFFDTDHPDRSVAATRSGSVEQRGRPGAWWLGYAESGAAAAENSIGLAVAFTPSADILATDLAAAGALQLWLRKFGSPSDAQVAIGAGATPDVALAAATWTGTVSASAVSNTAGGGRFGVTLSGAGDLPAGIKHWLILNFSGAPSTSNYCQAFGWWGGRYPSLPFSEYRAAAAAPWSPESADFSPWFTLATLGHAPGSSFEMPVFALGDSSSHARIAQRFRPAADVTVGALQLWLAGHSSSTAATNLPISICVDDGGVPGTTIATFMPAWNANSTMQAWTTHQAGGAVYAFPPAALTLPGGQDCWLVIDAAAIDGTNFFRVFGTVDGPADGYGAKWWNGSAWIDIGADSGTKLYFTLYGLPSSAAPTGPLPETSLDDCLIVSPRPARNELGLWDDYATRKRIVGGTYGVVSYFSQWLWSGNVFAGGSAYEPVMLSATFADAPPVSRGLVAAGNAPGFNADDTYPLESADPVSSGCQGFYRFADFRLAPDLTAASAIYGQLRPALIAERARAAGVQLDRDLLAISGV